MEQKAGGYRDGFCKSLGFLAVPRGVAEGMVTANAQRNNLTDRIPRTEAGG